jgi:hypothetical protein
LDLEKDLFWKLVPCVEVSLVSKFYSILCLVTQESKLGSKCLVLKKNYEQFWADRTSPSRFLDKSGTITGGLVWVGNFSSTLITILSVIC